MNIVTGICICLLAAAAGAAAALFVSAGPVGNKSRTPKADERELLDYFAAAALTGWCASPGWENRAASLASWAYGMAEAMMLEREKRRAK